MPSELFNELSQEKKSRIMEAALKEFAEHGYNEGSTNRIVKEAAIAKGSLFKYFKNKEELYFDVLDHAIGALTNGLKDELKSLPQDFFERIIKFAEMEISWYIKNPVHYKLIRRAFGKDNEIIYNKTIEKYGDQAEVYYYSMFEDINDKQFRADKKKVLNIIKWFLEGYNQSFIIEDIEGSLDVVKRKYMEGLKEYIEILKIGL
ncbi:TetR/AcrR family transcriptional regulator [Alkaliphilus transvaalensis]|uniref:TetR/AcrR family transcriptional regulator n=1 Tax=Alkaliphilus transvaalensis TaxID=114628 RepID=UPI00047D66D4|nr:TetR/AcrR family transcriptional regulator [Alkaliphilus transvaalensis]